MAVHSSVSRVRATVKTVSFEENSAKRVLLKPTVSVQTGTRYLLPGLSVTRYLLPGLSVTRLYPDFSQLPVYVRVCASNPVYVRVCASNPFMSGL